MCHAMPPMPHVGGGGTMLPCLPFPFRTSLLITTVVRTYNILLYLLHNTYVDRSLIIAIAQSKQMIKFSYRLVGNDVHNLSNQFTGLIHIVFDFVMRIADRRTKQLLLVELVYFQLTCLYLRKIFSLASSKTTDLKNLSVCLCFDACIHDTMSVRI